jgi:predicted transcriptional regulator
MSTIIDWDGHAVPEQLKQLPKGRYIIVPAESEPLTDEEDTGLRAGLDSAEAGQVKPAEEVRRRLDEMVAQCR